MAESLDGLKTVIFPMDTSKTACDRFKVYKKSIKESEEVKSTRKLLEGIKLRRDERGKEVRTSWRLYIACVKQLD
jgi:hypothetical protein